MNESDKNLDKIIKDLEEINLKLDLFLNKNKNNSKCLFDQYIEEGKFTANLSCTCPKCTPQY